FHVTGVQTCALPILCASWRETRDDGGRMTFTRTEMIAVVERSPHTIEARDRHGWVDLFTPDARIEDPVGSRPHIGRDRIERFYEIGRASRRDRGYDA